MLEFPVFGKNDQVLKAARNLVQFARVTGSKMTRVVSVLVEDGRDRRAYLEDTDQEIAALNSYEDYKVGEAG